MSIIINHRFLNRINDTSEYKKIDYLIIGTFNPGHPEIPYLNPDELKEFETIASGKKFKKLSEVRNFYDRPQNRFWKIMDYINNPEFYEAGSFKTKNPNGLKFYKSFNRENIYSNQKKFCIEKGIFITDIVRQIKPDNFKNIYSNFPDKQIENSKPKFNTEMINAIIKKHKPQKILVNFNINLETIPNISKEIIKIHQVCNRNILFMKSTSGAAGNSYIELVENWKMHFNFK